MTDEKRWGWWRVSRIAESARHVGVGILLAGALAAGFNPEVGLDDAWPFLAGGLAMLCFGWIY